MPDTILTPTNSTRPYHPAREQFPVIRTVLESPTLHTASPDAYDAPAELAADDLLVGLLTGLYSSGAIYSWHGSDGVLDSPVQFNFPLDDVHALLAPPEGIPVPPTLTTTALGPVQHTADDVAPEWEHDLRAPRPALRALLAQENQAADDADDVGPGLPPMPQLALFHISLPLLADAEIQLLGADHDPNVSFQWAEDTPDVSAATLEALLIACDPPTPLQLQNARSE